MKDKMRDARCEIRLGNELIRGGWVSGRKKGRKEERERERKEVENRKKEGRGGIDTVVPKITNHLIISFIFPSFFILYSSFSS